MKHVRKGKTVSSTVLFTYILMFIFFNLATLPDFIFRFPLYDSFYKWYKHYIYNNRCPFLDSELSNTLNVRYKEHYGFSITHIVRQQLSFRVFNYSIILR